MKKLLFIGILSLSLPAIAQEITEKNGLLGFKDERGELVLQPEYRGIKRVETANGQYVIFAKADPEREPESDEDPFASTDERLPEGLSVVFNERFLFGIMDETNPKSRTECKYKQFSFPAFGANSQEQPILLAFDGMYSDIYEVGNLSKAINKPKQLQILENISNQWDYSLVFIHLYNDFKGVIALNPKEQQDKVSYQIQPILPCQYNQIDDFLHLNENRYYIAQDKEGKYQFIDPKGQILLKNCDSIRSIQMATPPDSPKWWDYLRVLAYSSEKKGKKTELWDFAGRKPELVWSGEYAEPIDWAGRPALLTQKGAKKGFLAYADEQPLAVVAADYEDVWVMEELLYARKGNVLDIYGEEKLYSLPDASSVDFHRLPAGLGLLAVNKIQSNSEYPDVLSIWDVENQKYLLEYTNYWTIDPQANVLLYSKGGQNGKKGFFDLAGKKKLTEAVFDFVGTDLIPNSDGNSGVKIARVSQNKQMGLLLWGTNQFIVPMQYAQISQYQPQYQYFEVAVRDSASGNLAYGLLNARGEQILACEYEHSTSPSQDRYLWLSKKGGKKQVFDLKTKQWLPQMKGVELLGEAEQGYWQVRKDGKIGKLRVNDWQFEFLETVEQQFPLKWKSQIGITTYRTNILFANNQLIIGSNGRDREKIPADDLDGLYLLNPKTGQKIQQLNPSKKGDDDVNGVAVDGQRLYFAGDAGILYCYDFKGGELWSLALAGEVEGSPALADLNGDKRLDVVVATEKPAKIYAVDAQTGKPIWENSPTTSGYFVATPALADINGDKVADVLIGAGGDNHFFAIDGRTGRDIWSYKTLSTRGFVDGSGVHSSATVLINPKNEPTIVLSECYGIIHFLDKNGKLQKYIPTDIGVFSSPVFSPQMSVINGCSWQQSGGVNIALAGKSDSWQQDPKTGLGYMPNENHFIALSNPNAPVASSAFVADLLGKKSSFQLGIADEVGRLMLFDENNGQMLRTLSLPAGVEAPMLVADIDQDGKLELVVACLDGYVYCYGTNAPASAVYWGQFRADNQNTGRLKTR